MSYSFDFDPPWRWYWRTDDQGNADCGIYAEPRPGHAYSIVRCPRYMTKEQWEQVAERIVSAVNEIDGLRAERDTYREISNIQRKIK